MKTTAFLLSVAFALSASALPASAQSGTPDTDIVVTGQSAMDEDQTREVVRRMAKPVGGQLARFHERVCPHVMGFDAPYANKAEEWIKTTAEAIGARVGGENCEPNLFVVIVDDGPGFVRELAREHPGALAGVSEHDFEQLSEQAGAARSWSVTALTNSEGMVASNPSASLGGGAVKTGFQGSSMTFDSSVKVLRVYETSNAFPVVQQTIAASWVVIETGATFGKSLNQIADYAAMRGLAMVQPSELAGSADTILDLFETEASDPGARLTSFDRAYLTSLYRVPPRRWARSQVHAMAEQIAREGEQGTP